MDILRENRLRISQAAGKLGVSTSTLWRWILRGVRGKKLESALIGGQRYTSEEAIQRFVAPQEEHESLAETRKQHQQTIAQAEKELIDAGA